MCLLLQKNMLVFEVSIKTARAIQGWTLVCNASCGPIALLPPMPLPCLRPYSQASAGPHQVEHSNRVPCIFLELSIFWRSFTEVSRSHRNKTGNELYFLRTLFLRLGQRKRDERRGMLWQSSNAQYLRALWKSSSISNNIIQQTFLSTCCIHKRQWLCKRMSLL